MQRSFIVFLKLYHFCGGVRIQVGDKNVTPSNISTYRKVKNTHMVISNFYECKSLLDTGLCTVELFNFSVWTSVICRGYTSLHLLLIFNIFF